MLNPIKLYMLVRYYHRAKGKRSNQRNGRITMKHDDRIKEN